MSITKLRKAKHSFNLSQSKTADQKRRKMMKSSLTNYNKNNTYDDSIGSLATNPYSRIHVRAKTKGRIYKSSFNMRTHNSANVEQQKLNLKKLKSMGSINNNEKIKLFLSNLQMRNPSIPCNTNNSK